LDSRLRGDDKLRGNDKPRPATSSSSARLGLHGRRHQGARPRVHRDEPGSSFRSLQESLVNYGGNKKPELLTCMHEEAAIAMAHGYAKARRQAHGGARPRHRRLQHGSMAIYNAWVDRVPIMIFTGNGSDAAERRPGTEWNHAAQDVPRWCGTS
jgi:hypothetical protein